MRIESDLLKDFPNNFCRIRLLTTPCPYTHSRCKLTAAFGWLKWFSHREYWISTYCLHRQSNICSQQRHTAQRIANCRKFNLS